MSRRADLDGRRCLQRRALLWRAGRHLIRQAGGEGRLPEGDHAAGFALEDASFWFRHRNRCIGAAVKKVPALVPAFDWPMRAALAAHFDIVYMTALFERLVPAFFLARTLPFALGLRGRSGRQFQAEHQPGGATGTTLLERLLAHEINRIERGQSLRWGSTLLVVARRR